MTFTTILVPSEKEISLKNVGFCNYPNWRLQKAREQSHQLNLFIIGPPGVGKASTINTLFNKTVIPLERERLVDENDMMVAQHNCQCIEGGISLNVNITELLNYDSPARLKDRILLESIVNHLTRKHQEKYQNESTIPRSHPSELYDAVLYFIPPTFKQFTAQEISLIREIQRVSIFVPIISKADMYLPEELKEKKLLIRAQFEAHGLEYIPRVCGNFQDTWLLNDLKTIEKNWPMAIISSKDVYENGSRFVRGRKYPWGLIDVDNEEFSDLYSLQLLLISSFFQLNKEYVDKNLYELIWRPFFIENQEKIRSLSIYKNYLLSVATENLQIKEDIPNEIKSPIYSAPISVSSDEISKSDNFNFDSHSGIENKDSEIFV